MKLLEEMVRCMGMKLPKSDYPRRTTITEALCIPSSNKLEAEGILED
jgi:hypothetical protein